MQGFLSPSLGCHSSLIMDLPLRYSVLLEHIKIMQSLIQTRLGLPHLATMRCFSPNDRNSSPISSSSKDPSPLACQIVHASTWHPGGVLSRAQTRPTSQISSMTTGLDTQDERRFRGPVFSDAVFPFEIQYCNLAPVAPLR